MSNSLTAEQVLASAPNATVLTIDFFDTLVTRSVAQPTHVFAVMEAALVAEFGDAWRGFAVVRVEAEHAAREKMAEVDDYADITLDDIIDELAQRLNLSMVERAMLLAREEETEISLARAVPFGMQMVEAARARGMRVVIVSDNYMSSTHLMNKAHAAGYTWVTNSDIFVSCEHGGQKHNGKLWSVVMDAIGVSAERLLHVGDDATADDVVPRSLGITTHVRDQMRRSHRAMINTSPSVLPLSRIEATFRDAYEDAEWDSAEVVGGGLVAMLVAAQIIDVQAVLAQRDLVGVHFAARDGYLAHQVWNQLRDQGMMLPFATYTAFSRSVVWRSNVVDAESVEFERFVGDDEFVTCERLERRVGCSLVSDLAPDVLLAPIQSRAILQDNVGAIVEAATALRTRLLGYLRSHGVMDVGHHLVVDLGWTATTVADLAALAQSVSGDGATFEGRFTGLYWDATPQRARTAIHGFAMDDLGSTDDNVRLLGVIKLLEALVTAPHGSVVDYDIAENGFAPLFVETQPELDAYEAIVSRIADAAVRGAMQILQGTHPSGVTAADITGDAVWAAIMQVGHTPRADEIAELSVINHVTSIDHEGMGRPLISSGPEKPAEMHIDELPEMYDTLIRRHWLRGSLASFAGRPDAQWIADEMYLHQPVTHPRWVP
jgi:FMN phosphatase YigB (HAD superfamily)